jgi:hypothetical protein
MPTINRCDTPPRPGPDLRIYRVKQPGTFLFICLSRSLWGCWTHWSGNESIPCTGENSECYGHARGMPKRWKGFLHCFAADGKTEVFLELTPSAAEQINFQVEKGFDLRGSRLQVTRGQGGKHSRLKVVVLPCPSDRKDLPLEKDPMLTLGRLWEMRRAFGPDA